MIGSINSSAVLAPARQADGCSSETGGLSPEEQLLALLVFSEMSRSNAAKDSVHLSSEQLDVLREEARRALQAAHDAQEHSGFWSKLSSLFSGDIASLAEVVAMAAATVATGGTAALVLGAIALGATLASKYADELGIPPNVAIALGVAAGLASVASGNLGGGLSHFTALGEAANATKFYYQGVAATATAAGSVSHGVAVHYQGQALDDKADVKDFENQQVLESSDIEANLELLQSALDRQLAYVSATNQFARSDHQSTQQVIQDFSGAA
jgi:hypothetical protein